MLGRRHPSSRQQGNLSEFIELRWFVKLTTDPRISSNSVFPMKMHLFMNIYHKYIWFKKQLTSNLKEGEPSYV